MVASQSIRIQLCMGHLAGCVSRKICGSVEGSEVVCHLKRWQKHKTRAVAAFSTLLVERAAPRGPREQKRLDRIQREFVLWAQGELENLPDMRPEESYCGYSILFVLSMFTRAGGKSLATAVSGEQ